MNRNITLSIDENLLQKARLACRKRNLSLNNFVRNRLEELVHQDEEYQGAQRRMAELIERRPIRIGKKTWTRAQLHER